jgi:hypothetical protein
MNVILFKDYLKTIRNKEFKPTVICEIESIYEFPHGLISIEGKLAKCCSFDDVKNFLTIEYVQEPINEDEIFGHNEIKCPYCGDEKTDSWEYSDDGTEHCDSCGSEYIYERIVDVSYTTIIKNKNDKITKLK